MERDEALQAIQDKIDQKKSALRKAKRKVEEYASVIDRIGLLQPQITQPLAAPVHSKNLNIFAALNKEKQAIDAVIREAKHQMRINSNQLDAIRGNPESSLQITYALFLVTVLFYMGVICPLSFLPMSIGGEFELSFCVFWNALFTLKGLLLVVTSLVFTAVLVMFFWLNIKLKYPQDIVREVEQFSQLSAYSHYFGIYDENQFRGASNHDS